MKSLESIKKSLEEAAEYHKEGDWRAREDSLLNAFSILEIERLKFHLWGKFDLGEIGNELERFTGYLNTLIFQFTSEHGCIDSEEWDGTVNIRLDTLEHYINKILAISKILLLEENRDRPISIYGVTERKQLFPGKEEGGE